MPRIGLFIVTVWVALAVARASASAAPIGGEFQINGYTTESQYSPAVCRDGAGNFVVTWQSFEQDGEAAGVLGPAISERRRRDRRGVPGQHLHARRAARSEHLLRPDR